MPDNRKRKRTTKIKRKYKKEFLKFGFTSVQNETEEDRPICLICHRKYENSSLVPAKLKRHLESVHNEYLDQELDFFVQKKDEYLNKIESKKENEKNIEKVIKASYILALNIIKAKKPTVLEKT